MTKYFFKYSPVDHLISVYNAYNEYLFSSETLEKAKKDLKYRIIKEITNEK